MAKRNTKKEYQKKAERRQRQFDQCHSEEAFAKARELRGRNQKKIAYELKAHNCYKGDMFEKDLNEKIKYGYEVWSSVYNSKRDNAIPFLLIADYDLPRAAHYLNDNRDEIYALIESTLNSQCRSDIKDAGLDAAIIYTNPSDGEDYGIIFLKKDDATKVAETFGLGSEFAVMALATEFADIVVFKSAA